MDLNTQIQQTKIALQILESRKQGTEPEWERQIQVAWNGQVAWVTGQSHLCPLSHVATGVTIRLKPATLPPGFLPWSGGECPVAGDTEVQIICREDDPQVPYKASSYRWEHQNNSDDIIAYRVIEPEKPWTISDSVNGFTLQDGQQWHREDWKKDMLPPGHRPLLYGEHVKEGDQSYMATGDKRWNFALTGGYAADNHGKLHFRTTRPLPVPYDPYAELRAAHAAGKVIQMYSTANGWFDIGQPDKLKFDLPIERYRIKPSEPQQPSIKLGDWIRIGGVASLVTSIGPDRIGYGPDSIYRTELFNPSYRFQISRDQGATWEPINQTQV